MRRLAPVLVASLAILAAFPAAGGSDVYAANTDGAGLRDLLHVNAATQAEAASSVIDCVQDPVGITHGPRVGAVDDHSVKLWVRTCAPGEDVVAEVKLAADDWASAPVILSEHELTDASKDDTAVVDAQYLDPDTRYEYRVRVNGALPLEPYGGRFETLPPQNVASQFSFVIGTDLHLPQYPVDQVLGTIMSHDPRFVILNGDNIYIESQTSAPSAQSDYEALYRKTWLQDTMPQFLANTPTFMIWDDHEIKNDWSRGTSPPYPLARAAYEEYMNSANPGNLAGDGVDYTLDAGQISFFVMDTRTFRSNDFAEDDANKTMLGATQKAALENWLLTSSARFKFIVSSVMWNDFSMHQYPNIAGGRDSWPAFETERNEIFDFIGDNRIPGVVLTSGDEHWTGAFKISPWGIYEIAGGPLSLFLPPTTATDPQILFKAAGVRVFASYSVDTQSCPATVHVQIVDAIQNKPIYELALGEQELGWDADGDGLVPCQEQQYGTDPGKADTDGDGCPDGREVGPDQRRGGRRNPTYAWDYFDTPDPSNVRDGRIRTNDLANVIRRYGAEDRNGAAAINRYTDPLSAPPATGYHPAFDRGPHVGSDPWDLGPPDGKIRISDVAAVLAQYRQDCK